jgi:hypothetical protein
MATDLRPRLAALRPVQPTEPGLRVPDALRHLRAPRPGQILAVLRLIGAAFGRSLRRVGRVVWRRRVPVATFTVFFLLYAVLGALLALRYSSYAGDAQSRLANAYYVLFSRDPHLGAIGFVWNPLPSLSVMPLLLLKGLWPDLAARAVAANIASAAFMAGSVLVLRSILLDLRVRRGARVLLTVLFALQPMIVLYGANGMSEAIFIFFLLLTCRRLARWLADNHTWDLVLAGTALAFAYLSRVEAIAPAVISAAVVTTVAAARFSGERKPRLRWAALHGFLFAAPAAFAFAVWTLTSWIITGHPLEQISSQYGTGSQLTAGGDVFELGRGGIAAPTYIGLQLAGLAPLLPLAVAGAAWTAVRRRDLRALAPAAVLGGVLLFEVVTFLDGQTVGNLRYVITAIPLLFILIGCALSRPATATAGWRTLRGGIAVLVVGCLALPSAATSAFAMADPRTGREEHPHLGFVFKPDSKDPAYNIRYTSDAAESMARYMDSLHVGTGDIVLDTFDAGTVCTPLTVLASRHPRQFVITNDRDFKPVVADPVTFGAKYLFVPQPVARGVLNELNRSYPTLYKSGAGIADLDKEFHNPGCPDFRLYKLRPRAEGQG